MPNFHTTFTVRTLTGKERERAMQADPREYPQEMPCMVCGFRWMQHIGKLCIKEPGKMLTQVSAIGPVPGETEFIPDMDFYKRPDFHVS